MARASAVVSASDCTGRSAGVIAFVVAALLALSTIGCAGSSGRPDELVGAIAFVQINRIFSVDAAESTLTRLGRRSASSGPAWSPDGTTLTYSTPDAVIMVANASGDGERRLVRRGCHGPIFSPTGAHIACEYTEPNQITVIEADDGRVVARTPDCCWLPAWSPDGRRIVYRGIGTYDRDSGRYVGPSGLFVTDFDGGNVRLISSKQPDGSTPPAWSPRGPIAFVSGGEIWTVSATGAGLRKIVSGDARPAGGLAWSPDGTKLAFQGGDGDYEVFVVNADGSGLTNLTNNQKIQDQSPSWSPDGQAIAFVSNRDDGLDQIFAMRVDGSGQTQLTHDDRGGACCPTWSPAR